MGQNNELEEAPNDAGWRSLGKRECNVRTRELLDQIKTLPARPARFSFIDSLSTSDRVELFKGLSTEDRKKYEQHLESTVGVRVVEERRRRLEGAKAGRAGDLGDALEVLLERIDSLSASDQSWVRRIDSTASEFKTRSKFTSRQSEVIWSIYRQNFPR